MLFFFILQIDSNRHVFDVSCNCVSNQSKKCKHVYALIHHVNFSESVSKTSYEQAWGTPTVRQLTIEKYSKGRFFCEMYPPKQIEKVQSYSFTLEDLIEVPCSLRSALLEEKKDQVICFIKLLVYSIVDNMFVKYNLNLSEACLESLLIHKEENPIFKCQNLESSLAANLKHFYETSVQLDENEIVKLNLDTVCQSKCSKWFDARLIRLSASKNVHEVKTLTKKTAATLANEIANPKKVVTESMKYGTKYENKALNEYQLLCSVHIIKLGVLIDKYQPWLCASVDGVVIENDCIDRLIEIKCPSSCMKKPIVDYEKKRCNVQYLTLYCNNVELRESSVYYTQCQFQLYVTGLTVCDLYVYSPEGSCLVQVHRNDSFLAKVVPLCEKFYFNVYLNVIYEKLKKEKSATVNKKTVKVMNCTRTFTGIDVQNVNH